MQTLDASNQSTSTAVHRSRHHQQSGPVGLCTEPVFHRILHIFNSFISHGAHVQNIKCTVLWNTCNKAYSHKKNTPRQITRIKTKIYFFLIFTTDVRENNVTESFLEHFCYNFQHWFTISLLFCFKLGKINQPTLTATCCPSWVSALWTWARLAAAIGSSSNFLKNSWGCFPKSSWNSCSIWNYIRHSTWSN